MRRRNRLIDFPLTTFGKINDEVFWMIHNAATPEEQLHRANRALYLCVVAEREEQKFPVWYERVKADAKRYREWLIEHPNELIPDTTKPSKLRTNQPNKSHNQQNYTPVRIRARQLQEQCIQLREKGLTYAEIAKRLGISRGRVGQLLLKRNIHNSRK